MVKSEIEDPRQSSADPTAYVAALAAGILVVMLWQYRDMVPMWDGWIYAHCILDAPGIPFRCGDHPALAWSAPMSLGKLWTPPGMVFTFMPSLLLAIVAIFGWARVVRKALGERAGTLEFATIVIAGTVNPGVVSTVLQPNVDLAVVAWGMWFLDGIAGGAIVQSVIAGALLCFSKETGVIIYCIGALVLWVSRGAQGRRMRDALVLALPVILYTALVFLPRLLRIGSSATIWGMSATGDVSLLRNFQPLNFWSRHLLNYVLLLTVLQFQWIASLVLGLGLFAYLRKRGFKWRDALPATPVRRLFLAVVISYAALTTFRTYGNLRYFALYLPFLWLAALLIAREAGAAAKMRVAVAGLAIPCLIVSSWRSVDPVSKRVFGTFALGRDRMFDMTHISHDCCGHGMDPLAYSLQFTALSTVLDKAMADLRPSDTLSVAMTKWEWGGWLTPLDRTTSMRTIDEVHGVRVPLAFAESLAVGRPGPGHIWYLEPPHMKDSSATVSRYYRATGVVRTYDAAGARLRIVEMQRIPGLN